MTKIKNEILVATKIENEILVATKIEKKNLVMTKIENEILRPKSGEKNWSRPKILVATENWARKMKRVNVLKIFGFYQPLAAWS